MIQTHCHDCGTPLIEKELEGDGIVPYCPKCEQYRFPMYNVAVSMVVINDSNGKVLLIKQYGRPNFILVAGYVNRGEELEHAVGREIKEETGMTVSRINFNRTSFFEPSNTLMCNVTEIECRTNSFVLPRCSNVTEGNFTAFVTDDSGMSPNGEIDSWEWFTPEEARRNIRPNSLAQRSLNAYLDE